MLVVFDPAVTSYDELLRLFWEGHDPTQGMRQGNDVGTQYRSAIYTTSEAQREAALSARATTYQRELAAGGLRRRSRPRSRRWATSTTPRTTTSSTWPRYPNGYCGLGGTGVSCPVGLGTAAPAGS